MTPHELEVAVYRTKFRRWEERASVRVKPRRVLGDAPATTLYFPPESVPFLGHPLIRARGQEVASEILMQRLHVYLDFTAELEQRAVNPICAAISRRRSGFALPPGMLEDAYKICTDEAWHAQFSDDMQRQIVARTSVAPVLPQTPAFMRRLAAANAAPETDGLGPLFFTIVSETLISAILTEIPRDARIDAGVRDLVADHAADEGVHHAYFAKLLEHVWPQLDARRRHAIGRLLPEFIRAFLDPDYDALAAIVRSIGLPADEVGEVLSDCFDEEALLDDQRGHARLTLRHFARVGVLDDPMIAEAFEAAGLLDPDDSLDSDSPATGHPR
jgi:hypothetical protein